MNKFFGILLYIFAAIMTLAFVGQLVKFLAAFINLFNIFSSEITGTQRGYIIGKAVYWIIHFTLIYFSFKYGSKLINKKTSAIKKQSSETE